MKVPREKLEAIFEAAAALETDAQRQEYLGRACPDLELRQEVESLLAAMKDPDSLFETKDDSETPSLDSIPVIEQPGTMIGRYKLLQKVGIGGMGVVYMAEQTEPVKRKVALKIIKLGMDTRQVVARFEAERQALAMMDHPNIAKVLDAGATETGRPFFVMELVRGVPITEYCDKNKLSTAKRLDLFMDVCRAIQHAHQKGIIHRDIKPSNVMVTLHDGNPVAKVIDFGIAKATNHNLTEKTLFTNYSQMIGTPAYMSPEQAEMSGLDVDTRTDVYSLGVLLYELLTGTTPFPSKELLSLGYGEMQRVITQEEPPKPSTRMSSMQNEQRTVVAKNRSIPDATVGDSLKGDLDWIVMKSLEKDRTQRYETVNAMNMDVGRFLKDEAVTAAAPSLAYQVTKFYRRNQRFVQTACVVGILLVLATVVSTMSARRANYMRDIANRARYQEAKAREAAEQLQEGEAEARTKAEGLLRESLIGQSEAWLTSRTRAYQTNVLNALKQARQLPGAEDDLARMRSLAWGALAEPFKKLWSKQGNAVPNAEALTATAYSTDSLAFGYRDGSIKIINIETGQMLQDLVTPTQQPILALAHHEQRDVWISCDAEGTVTIWTLGLGNRVEQSSHKVDFDQNVSALELLTSDRGFLLFSYREAEIWHWPTIDAPEAKEIVLPLSVPQNDFTQVQMVVNLLSHPPIALHPDGTHLAVAYLDASRDRKNLAVWDLDQETQITSLMTDYDFGANSLFGLAFSADGRVLGCANGKNVHTILTKGWNHFARHYVVGTSSSEYALAQSGLAIALGGAGLEIHNTITGDQLFSTTRDGGMPVFRNGNELLSVRIGRELRRSDTHLRWDATCFRVANSPYLSVLTTDNGQPNGASFSPDSQSIAISGINSLVVKNLRAFTTQVMEVERGDSASDWVMYEDPAFSPKGHLLAATYHSTGKEYGVRFWNVQTGRIVDTVKFGDGLGFVSFSPSQPFFAAVAGRKLGIWKYQMNTQERPGNIPLAFERVVELSLEQKGVCLAFHPTLNQLAWTEGEINVTQPKVRLFDLDLGKILPFDKSVTSSHYSATLLPQGTHIALSASHTVGGQRRRSIQIWDYMKNELLSERIAEWESSNNSWGLSGLSSSPDGRFLSFRSDDPKELMIFDLRYHEELLSIPSSQNDALWFSDWSSDGNYFMTLGSAGEVNVWHTSRIRQRLGEIGLGWEE